MRLPNGISATTPSGFMNEKKKEEKPKKLELFQHFE